MLNLKNKTLALLVFLSIVLAFVSAFFFSHNLSDPWEMMSDPFLRLVRVLQLGGEMVLIPWATLRLYGLPDYSDKFRLKNHTLALLALFCESWKIVEGFLYAFNNPTNPYMLITEESLWKPINLLVTLATLCLIPWVIVRVYKSPD